MKYPGFIWDEELENAGFEPTESEAVRFAGLHRLDKVAREHGKHAGQCENIDATRSITGTGYYMVYTWADEGPVKGAPGYYPPLFAPR